MIKYFRIFLSEGTDKMRRKLFNGSDVTPACRLCSHGMIAADGDSVLCVKTGIRQLDSSCRSFKYDPLKRVPKKNIGIGHFTEEDFKL